MILKSKAAAKDGVFVRRDGIEDAVSFISFEETGGVWLFCIAMRAISWYNDEISSVFLSNFPKEAFA